MQRTRLSSWAGGERRAHGLAAGQLGSVGSKDASAGPGSRAAGEEATQGTWRPKWARPTKVTVS